MELILKRLDLWSAILDLIRLLVRLVSQSSNVILLLVQFAEKHINSVAQTLDFSALLNYYLLYLLT